MCRYIKNYNLAHNTIIMSFVGFLIEMMIENIFINDKYTIV